MTSALPPASSAADALDQVLATLRRKGVVIPDPRQVSIGPEVDPDRIHAGARLEPGTRLSGAHTLIGPDAVVGSEGPAVLADVAMAEGAEIASGYVAGTVLLARARIGANGHVRPCTLLEEDASTAHAVGLKQTVLMSFVTLGSLINFCDALLAGGTSRHDHTEVGSGVIHFNFTPWGERGDKATPTLVGDVYDGALLRQPRIFLGGLSGIAGPRSIGFGALTPAGQVLRRDVPAARMVAEAPASVDTPFAKDARDFSESKDRRNRAFLSNLAALRAWYEQVRLPPLAPDGHGASIIRFAITLLDGMIEERVARLTAYRKPFGRPAPAFAGRPPPCPLAPPREPGHDHLAWVRALATGDQTALVEWLRGVGAALWSE